MTIKIIEVDYSNSQQAEDLVYMLNEYANDPMGGGEPLSNFARDNLTKELSQLPYAFSLLCYVDDSPAGFANCFESFSTFKCKPVIYIHDFAVKDGFRGRKLSQKILDQIESIGIKRGCCKITLEVLEGNTVAQNAYQKYGFKPYQLDSNYGSAQFWQKEIKQ